MEIYSYKRGQKLPVGDSAIAIGLFDGFHIAHRYLIEETAKEARKQGLSVGIFTFSSSGEIKERSKKIYSTEEKLEIAETLGIDFAVVAEFSEISDICAEDFVKETLIGHLSAKIAAVGFNFRFGKGAAGNAEMLKELMETFGGGAMIFDEYTHEDITVSSTAIRKLLVSGECEKANELLGKPYFLTGVVTHGDGRGRTLGLPTVNTDIPETKLEPKAGVYRSRVSIDGTLFNSVTNIGTCPTFGARVPHAETYILNFDSELYGKNIRIFLLEYLREERPFKDEKELKMQIKVDIEYTIKRNGDEKWQELGLK